MPSAASNSVPVLRQCQDFCSSKKERKGSLSRYLAGWMQDEGSTRRKQNQKIDFCFQLLFRLIWFPDVPQFRVCVPKSRENTQTQNKRLNGPTECSQVDYYLLMIHEDRDTALLALLESFMQSAPQLVLQLYILSDRYDQRLQADTLTGWKRNSS